MNSSNNLQNLTLAPGGLKILSQEHCVSYTQKQETLYFEIS